MEIKVRKKKILYYNSILGVWKRKTFVYAMFEILIYYRHYYSFSGKKKFMKKFTKTRKKTSCRILLNGQTIHF